MRTPAPLRRPHRDERGILTGFMLRTVLLLVLAGLVVVDGGAVIFARMQAQDVAETAAAVAAGAYQSSRDERRAQAAAETAVGDRDPDATLRSVRANPEDGTVRVRVTKQAPTILAHRIGFLSGFRVATGTAVGDPPPA